MGAAFSKKKLSIKGKTSPDKHEAVEVKGVRKLDDDVGSSRHLGTLSGTEVVPITDVPANSGEDRKSDDIPTAEVDLSAGVTIEKAVEDTVAVVREAPVMSTPPTTPVAEGPPAVPTSPLPADDANKITHVEVTSVEHEEQHTPETEVVVVERVEDAPAEVATSEEKPEAENCVEDKTEAEQSEHEEDEGDKTPENEEDKEKAPKKEKKSLTRKVSLYSKVCKYHIILRCICP